MRIHLNEMLLDLRLNNNYYYHNATNVVSLYYLEKRVRIIFCVCFHTMRLGSR